MRIKASIAALAILLGLLGTFGLAFGQAPSAPQADSAEPISTPSAAADSSEAGQTPEAAEATLEVTFLDVGHGDCIYVHLPKRPDMLYDDFLVDGGDSGRGAKALRDFLKERGEEEVDLVFLTHAHSDHCGGLAKVLPEVKFDHFYYSGTDYPSRTFGKLKELAGDKAEVLKRGDTIDLDSDEEDKVSLRVLSPPSEGALSKEENDNSLVLMLSFGEEDFLLTGDIEEKTEAQLVEEYGEKLEAEVVKVPHHGSDTSSSEPFVAAVRAKYAVVSTDGKRYHLPKEAVLERYRDTGAEVLRTDEDGNITFLATEDSLTVKVEGKEEPSEAGEASAAGSETDGADEEGGEGGKE